jgi:hypothetical protein
MIHGIPSGPGRLHRKSLILASAILGASGCGPVPPPYEFGIGSTAGSSYCTAFLRFAHASAAATTTIYLISVCLAVILGFLAAQLSNDPTEKSLLKKHRSTFLFVGAATAGILGAYFHSRANAASKAAADVDSALAVGRDWAKYKLCLAAASRWDGSRADSLDAASVMAAELSSSGNTQAKNSMTSGAAASEQVSGATDKASKALHDLSAALEEATNAPGNARPAKEKLIAARRALKDATVAVETAKLQAASASQTMRSAKQSFSAAIGEGEDNAPPPSQRHAPRLDGGANMVP